MTEREREMLEHAATAAGYSVHGSVGSRFIVNFGDGIRGEWNPLQDDGDAARLRTKLRLGVTWDVGDIYVCVFELYGDKTWCEYFSDHNNDPDAALRWATVRAASEVKG